MRFLVTAVGGDVGQGVTSVLRRHFPQCEIIGTDTRLRHAGAHLVDRFVPALMAADPGYLDWLNSVAADSHAVLPCSDDEIWAITEASEQVTSPVIIANRRAVAVGQDKLATSTVLREAGIPTPLTVLASQAESMDYPCIIKPRRGQGSRGVQICSSEAEALALATAMPEAILQELLTPADEEVTCGVYRTGDGRTAVIQLRRALAAGATVWAEVIDDPQVAAYCTRIAELLELRGSINLQLIRTVDGPRLFEINPRFSSTVAMRDALGFTDVAWAVREVLFAEPALLSSPEAGRIAYRVNTVELA